MSETGFITSSTRPTTMVVGYDLAMQPLPFMGVSDLGIGAGGVYSDLHDMLIYLQANVRPDTSLLGRAMVLSQTLGLGWDSLPGTLPTHKNGLMVDGYATDIEFNPAEQIGVIVLADTFNSGSVMSVGAIAMGAKDNLVEPPIDSKFISAVSGVYNAGQTEIDVSAVGSSHLSLTVKHPTVTYVLRLMAIKGETSRFTVNNGSDENDEVEFTVDPETSQMKLRYYSYGGTSSEGQPLFKMNGLFTRQ